MVWNKLRNKENRDIRPDEIKSKGYSNHGKKKEYSNDKKRKGPDQQRDRRGKNPKVRRLSIIDDETNTSKSRRVSFKIRKAEVGITQSTAVVARDIARRLS